MALLTLKLKIKLLDSKIVDINSNIRISIEKNSNNISNDNNSKKFKRKLIKSKSGNLVILKGITKNNTLKIEHNFLILATKFFFI